MSRLIVCVLMLVGALATVEARKISTSSLIHAMAAVRANVTNATANATVTPAPVAPAPTQQATEPTQVTQESGPNTQACTDAKAALNYLDTSKQAECDQATDPKVCYDQLWAKKKEQRNVVDTACGAPGDYTLSDMKHQADMHKALADRGEKMAAMTRETASKLQDLLNPNAANAQQHIDQAIKHEQVASEHHDQYIKYEARRQDYLKAMEEAKDKSQKLASDAESAKQNALQLRQFARWNQDKAKFWDAKISEREENARRAGKWYAYYDKLQKAAQAKAEYHEKESTRLEGLAREAEDRAENLTAQAKVEQKQAEGLQREAVEHQELAEEHHQKAQQARLDAAAALVNATTEHENARVKKKEYRAAVAAAGKLHQQALEHYDQEREWRDRAEKLRTESDNLDTEAEKAEKEAEDEKRKAARVYIEAGKITDKANRTEQQATEHRKDIPTIRATVKKFRQQERTSEAAADTSKDKAEEWEQKAEKAKELIQEHLDKKRESEEAVVNSTETEKMLRMQAETWQRALDKANSDARAAKARADAYAQLRDVETERAKRERTLASLIDQSGETNFSMETLLEAQKQKEQIMKQPSPVNATGVQTATGAPVAANTIGMVCAPSASECPKYWHDNSSLWLLYRADGNLSSPFQERETFHDVWHLNQGRLCCNSDPSAKVDSLFVIAKSECPAGTRDSGGEFGALTADCTSSRWQVSCSDDPVSKYLKKAESFLVDGSTSADWQWATFRLCKATDPSAALVKNSCLFLQPGQKAWPGFEDIGPISIREAASSPYFAPFAGQNLPPAAPTSTGQWTQAHLQCKK